MSRHRASSMINMYGLNYCADHTNGKIYEYSLDIYTDDGDTIIKERDTAVIHGGLFGVPGKKLYFDEVEFIIVAGQTEVAGTGLGPQPIVPGAGLCGVPSDLTQGQLLNVGGLSQTLDDAVIMEGTPFANSVSFTDSNVVSFTFAFTKAVPPDSPNKLYITDLYDIDKANSNFAIYMDSDGYINIVGRNAAGTPILDVQITNNGATFADENLYMFGGVINLSNTASRELYINNSNIGENAAYTTWNTYTDDTLELSDTGAAPNRVGYYFGTNGTNHWSTTAPGYNGDLQKDMIGFVSFDDTCSLIPFTVWDDNGWVRDPQAWSGWYLAQPQVFFGPTFYKNSGKTAPATHAINNMEAIEGAYYGVSQSPAEPGIINLGIGGTIEAAVSDGDTGTLPDPPAAPDPVEIVAPFWENDGDWIDLSKLTQTTFVGMFGAVIEGADFNSGFDVNKAALVNTADTGNRIQIKDTDHCTRAALYITDSDGNVVDTMIYSGVWSGDSVLVPTDADYYVVITSDTGRAKVKKWDTIT